MIRKGQITLESLLLYGVAILVVLLAVGALTYFGILDLGRLLPDRCNLASAGTIECEEWSVVKTDDDGGIIQLGIRNVGPRAVEFNNATYAADGTTAPCLINESRSDMDPIRSGEIAAIVIECDEGQLFQNVGQKTRGNLVITYQFTDGAINNTVGGQLLGSISG